MDITTKELIPQGFNEESNGENTSNEKNSSIFDFSDHLDFRSDHLESQNKEAHDSCYSEPSNVPFTTTEVTAGIQVATEELSPESFYEDPIGENTSNERKEESEFENGSCSECVVEGSIPSFNNLTDHRELPDRENQEGVIMCEPCSPMDNNVKKSSFTSKNVTCYSEDECFSNNGSSPKNKETEDQDPRSLKEHASLNPTQPLTSTPKKLNKHNYGNAFKSLRKAFKEIMGNEFESQGGSQGIRKR